MSKTDYKPTYIFLDIETLPTQNEVTQARVVEKLTAPGNYKKPEAIDKWIEENKEAAIRKTSLSGLYGSIFCAGVAVGDEAPVILKGDELDILKQLSEITEPVENSVYVGHNLRKFDIPFIIQRQMINGIKPLFHHSESFYGLPVIDTMEVFSVNPREYVSLDNLCYVLGVETPKGDLDGSKVYDYWLAGKHQEIYDYCGGDVIAMRKCFYKLVG